MATPKARKRTTRAHRSSTSGVSPDALPVIGRYTAVVSLTLERSEISVTDPDTLEANRAALAADPGYASDWPSDAATLPAEKLLIARLKANFDFGAQLDDGTPDQIRSAVDRRWGTVSQARQQLAQQRSTKAYERIQVDALIRSDGRGEWGFTHADPTRSPLPINGEIVPGRPELDLFIQNLVRADLAQALAA